MHLHATVNACPRRQPQSRCSLLRDSLLGADGDMGHSFWPARKPLSFHPRRLADWQVECKNQHVLRGQKKTFPGFRYSQNTRCFSDSYAPIQQVALLESEIHRRPLLGPRNTGITVPLGISLNGNRAKLANAEPGQKLPVRQTVREISPACVDPSTRRASGGHALSSLWPPSHAADISL
jgi:hypothetical protein